MKGHAAPQGQATKEGRCRKEGQDNFTPNKARHSESGDLVPSLLL